MAKICNGAAVAGERAARIRDLLDSRSIVLVGIMGAGKTTIGRRLARRLRLRFVDADAEIEAAARLSVTEIFDLYGEECFRDGERRVIARLLGRGPQVLATGGGAFMNEETRENIARAAISVWLKADLETLMERVRRRDTRPLLKDPDPVGVMRRLIAVRYPVYALADITVESRDVAHEQTVDDIVVALERRLDGEAAAGHRPDAEG